MMKSATLTALCVAFLALDSSAHAQRSSVDPGYEGAWLLMSPKPKPDENLALTFEGDLLFAHRCGRAYGYRILSLKPFIVRPLSDLGCERPESSSEKLLTRLVAGKPKLSLQNQGRELKLELTPTDSAVFLRDTAFVD